MSPHPKMSDQPIRRHFLKFLATSPLLAETANVMAQEQRLPDPSMWAPRALQPLIESPREALSVLDFEPVMHKRRKPHFDGLDLSSIDSTGATSLTWDFIKRLHDTVKTKLVLKGLMTPADAILAVDNGLDAIIVSNHGGRDDDFGHSPSTPCPRSSRRSTGASQCW